MVYSRKMAFLALSLKCGFGGVFIEEWNRRLFLIHFQLKQKNRTQGSGSFLQYGFSKFFNG